MNKLLRLPTLLSLGAALLLASCQGPCPKHSAELSVITLRNGDDCYSFNHYQTDIRSGYSFTYRSFKGSYTHATKQLDLGQLSTAEMQPILDALCDIEKREHHPTPIASSEPYLMPYPHQVSITLHGKVSAYNGDKPSLQESYVRFWNLVKQYAAAR